MLFCVAEVCWFVLLKYVGLCRWALFFGVEDMLFLFLEYLVWVVEVGSMLCFVVEMVCC